jgi:hypothetical protein
VPETEEEIEETTPEMNELTPPKTEEEIEVTADVIDTALQSLSSEQANKENSLAPIKSVVQKKVKDLGINPDQSTEIDVFDEDTE